MSTRTVPTVVRLVWSAGRWFWLISVGLAALAGLATPLAVWLSKVLVDDLSGPRPVASHVVMLAAAAAAAAVVSSLMSTTAGLFAAHAQQAISLATTERLYRAVGTREGISHIENPDFQNKLQLAERAAQDAPMHLSGTLIAIVQGLAMIIGVTGGMFAVWHPMPLIMLAVVVPSVLAQRTLARRQADTFTEAAPHHRNRYVFSQLITGRYGAKESRVFGLKDFLLGRMLESQRKVSELEIRAVRASVLTENLIAIAIGCVTVAGSAYVGYLAASRHLTVGAFVYFVMAIALVQGAVMGLFSQAALALSSLQLFGNYLDVLEAADVGTSDRERTAASASRAAEISVEDVWFRYNKSSDWALRGVCFAVEAGQTVGIVGLNGAGKSTIVKLLCRLYEPTRGSIRFRGKDLADYDADELMKGVTVTFQDYATYDLVAAECIGVGRLKYLADRGLIRSSARIAEMDDVLMSLPRGYDTLLSQIFLDPSSGIVGSTLSGGQNQRIALARAFMRLDADLMILDEPSAGLDAEAEEKVYGRLREARKGKTTIIVTHRLNLLSDADQVLVFENGVISEAGTPRELLRRSGSYARLFAIQSAGFDRQATDDIYDASPAGVPQ
jgi:ATP-binding cassette, subfamily B, bacterial